MANLVSVERASLALGTTLILDGVSLGVSSDTRIGVVGRNGGGKTTLLRVLAGLHPVDEGRVTMVGSLTIGMLTQVDTLDPEATIRKAALGDLPEHRPADRRLGVKGVGLGEHADGQRPDHGDAPLVHRLKTGKHPQQGGLAATVASHDTYAGITADAEGHAVEDEGRAERQRGALDRDEIGHRVQLLLRPVGPVTTWAPATGPTARFTTD